MCGISGIMRTGEEKELVNSGIVEMTNELMHRGPDDFGYYVDHNIALGFRRLSIIDLKHGNQPLYNEDKSLIMVCNGEIFNYKKLKKQLQLKGHNFYTSCDVEVIPHLYEEYGLDMFDKLNGQFAFALYNRNNRKVLLARDHFGIAPLFYTQLGKDLIFGSEIKSLLKYPEIPRSVNLTALDQIFTFPGVISPSTMFKGIYSLKPGHFLFGNPDEFEVKEYWDLVYPSTPIESTKPKDYYIDKLSNALTQSVNYRLNSDVPIGLYISGGLDSSIVASLSKTIKPDTDFHSFSIVFGDKHINESKYQELMAKSIKSRHHSYLFKNEDILLRLKTAIFHAECPLKETYNTCSLALSELANLNNIKVVLGGEGADELFGGYVGYKFDSLGLGASTRMDPEEILDMQIRDKLWGDENLLYDKHISTIEELKLGLYSNPVKEVFNEFNSAVEGVVDKSKLAGRNSFHKRSYLDFKLRLSDHLVADHGDRVGYANSVEIRYPFLDLDVMNCVKDIPISLINNPMNEKELLKMCAKEYVPKSIMERQKFSFVAPGSNYLMRLNDEWINDTLSFDTIKRQGYFNPNVVERVKENFSKEDFDINQTFETDILMIVLTFGIFLDLFEMPNF